MRSLALFSCNAPPASCILIRVHPLCEVCGERPATVFITKIVDNDSSKHCFCTQCANEQVQGQGWLSELAEQVGDVRLIEDVQEAIEQFSFESFVSQLGGDAEHAAPFGEDDGADDVFAEDDELDDEELNDLEWDAARPGATPGSGEWVEDDFEDDPFAPESGSSFLGDTPESVARCPGCGTTWDRIRADGRAGCAACYGTFRDQIAGVMAREQRGMQHIGKTPRAAQKRKRRLEHLRQRRDNQLQLLQNRLKDAVASERYEEAAQLRDRIKIVASTIMNE